MSRVRGVHIVLCCFIVVEPIEPCIDKYSMYSVVDYNIQHMGFVRNETTLWGLERAVLFSSLFYLIPADDFCVPSLAFSTLIRQGVLSPPFPLNRIHSNHEASRFQWVSTDLGKLSFYFYKYIYCIFPSFSLTLFFLPFPFFPFTFYQCYASWGDVICPFFLAICSIS